MYYHVLSASYICACVLHIHYTLYTVTATACDLFCIAMATNQHFRLHCPIVNATLLYPEQTSYSLGALRESLYFPTPDTNNILIWKGNLGLWCGASVQLLLCQKLSLRWQGVGPHHPCSGQKGSPRSRSKSKWINGLSLYQVTPTSVVQSGTTVLSTFLEQSLVSVHFAVFHAHNGVWNTSFM